MLNLYGALLSLSLIWGLSFVFIKILLEPARVWGVVFLRCLFGAAALLPILLAKRLPLRMLPWGPIILVGVLNAGIPWGLIAWSETVIHSGTAAVLGATTPIWAGLIGLWAYNVSLSGKQWSGVAAGFAGILILTDFRIDHLFGDQWTGVGMMLAATASYGFAAQIAGRRLANVPVVIMTFATMATGCVTGLLGMGLTHGFEVSALLNPEAAGALIGLGIFGSGVAHLLYYFLIARGGSVFAANVTYLIPLTAVFWGWVLLDEPLSPRLFAGMLAIFAGVWLSSGTANKNMAEQKTARQKTGPA